MSKEKESSKKPFKVLDRKRTCKKGIMVVSLEDLITKGKSKFSYPNNQEVSVVLEEDGTEVEDDEYLFSLPDNTPLQLLHLGDRWSPLAAAVDEVDSSSSRLPNLLVKLERSPASVALLDESDLELLVDIDLDSTHPSFTRFNMEFLRDVQSAAEKHLEEKGKIRDTIGLLEIYHSSRNSSKSSKRRKV